MAGTHANNQHHDVALTQFLLSPPGSKLRQCECSPPFHWKTPSLSWINLQVFKSALKTPPTGWEPVCKLSVLAKKVSVAHVHADSGSYFVSPLVLFLPWMLDAIARMFAPLFMSWWRPLCLDTAATLMQNLPSDTSPCGLWKCLSIRRRWTRR